MSTAHYDVAVIGGGPGGYTAALYCARSGRSVVVLEKLSAGGQMATTDQVDKPTPALTRGSTALSWRSGWSGRRSASARPPSMPR